jgi:hypothetical protein
MHEGEVAHQTGVAQIRVVLWDLHWEKLSLVDDYSRGEGARDIKVPLTEPEATDPIMRLLPDEVELALKGLGRKPFCSSHKDLLHCGFSGKRTLPQGGVVGRDQPPPEKGLTLGRDEVLDGLLAERPFSGIGREKDHPDSESPCIWELDSASFLHLGSEELVRERNQNSSAVPGILLRT